MTQSIQSTVLLPLFSSVFDRGVAHLESVWVLSLAVSSSTIIDLSLIIMDRLGVGELPSLRAAFQIGFLLLPLYLVTWVIYTRYFHPLSSIPGPFWASISRIWLAKQAAGGNLDEVIRNLHGELGINCP